jgi:hypothetical protein
MALMKQLTLWLLYKDIRFDVDVLFIRSLAEVSVSTNMKVKVRLTLRGAIRPTGLENTKPNRSFLASSSFCLCYYSKGKSEFL